MRYEQDFDLGGHLPKVSHWTSAPLSDCRRAEMGVLPAAASWPRRHPHRRRRGGSCAPVVWGTRVPSSRLLGESRQSQPRACEKIASFHENHAIYIVTRWIVVGGGEDGAERSQLQLRSFDLDSTIPKDHRARLLWRAVETLDLSAFYEPIKARVGIAGRPSGDPIWLSARAGRRAKLTRASRGTSKLDQPAPPLPTHGVRLRRRAQPRTRARDDDWLAAFALIP